MTDLLKLRGVDPALAEKLLEHGIATPEALAATDPATLASIRGVHTARAALLVAAARDWLHRTGAAGQHPAPGPAPADGRTEAVEPEPLPGPLVVVPPKNGASKTRRKNRKTTAKAGRRGDTKIARKKAKRK